MSVEEEKEKEEEEEEEKKEEEEEEANGDFLPSVWNAPSTERLVTVLSPHSYSTHSYE